MKNILACIFSFSTIVTFAQTWDKSAEIDTLYMKNGRVTDHFSENARIYMIRNNDNLESIDFYYDAAGNLSSTVLRTEKKGIQYDINTYYYPNGTVGSTYFEYVHNRIFYGKPERDSVYFHYHPNGNVSATGYFADDKEHGRSTYYYPDGKIESEKEYSHGKLMNVKSFNPDGSLIDTGDFRDGNGRLIVFENGVKLRTCQYKNGKIVRRSCHCD
jgi:antitoxin component YwqK of YwqJK toxin-antitoxin module